MLEIYEPPRELNFKNVMYWETESRQLLELKQNGDKEAATLLTKAKHFLENDCIEQINRKLFIVKPIKNYNKTTYRIKNINDEEFICNCQGFSKNGICSHIIAVKQKIKIDNYKPK